MVIVFATPPAFVQDHLGLATVDPTPFPHTKDCIMKRGGFVGTGMLLPMIDVANGVFTFCTCTISRGLPVGALWENTLAAVGMNPITGKSESDRGAHRDAITLFMDDIPQLSAFFLVTVLGDVINQPPHLGYFLPHLKLDLRHPGFIPK
jgi:hypothetical protein